LNTNATAVLLNLKESDTTVATTFATFNAVYALSATNTAAMVSVLNVELKGRKRYLQVSVTPDTTTNGSVTSAVLGELKKDIFGANSANADQVAVG
jgi:hypothetical protein